MDKVDRNPKKRNYAFYGPFGSGKTSVAIKCCNKLIQKYSKDEGVTHIYVYAIVFDVTTAIKFIKTFKENIHHTEKVTVRCETFSTLLTETTYKKISIDSFFGGESRKDKIQSVLTHFEKKHTGHPCIFFFDEAQLLFSDYNGRRKDWSGLRLKSDKNHVIFCFSPIQKYSGGYVKVKLGDTFYSETFMYRYRNCLKIQQFSMFLSKKSTNNLNIDEERNIPCIQGDQPRWIDVGNTHYLIGNALKKLKSYTTKYSKDQTVLLYDDSLNDEMLTKINEAQGTLPMCNWREYVGCECDAVIYVSNGYGYGDLVSLVVGVVFWLVAVVFDVGDVIGVAVVFALGVVGAIVSGVVGGGGVAGVAGSVIVTVAVVAGVGAGGVGGVVVGGIGGAIFGGVVGGFFGGVIGGVVGSFLGANIGTVCAAFGGDVGMKVGVVGGCVGVIVGVFAAIVGDVAAVTAGKAGYHEATSRARCFIGIITVNNSETIL